LDGGRRAKRTRAAAFFLAAAGHLALLAGLAGARPATELTPEAAPLLVTLVAVAADRRRKR
jgi:hypothetical protein